MGLALAGAAGGAALLLWDSRSTEISKTFIETPEASVWVLAIAALTAYWALIAGPLWLTWWRVRVYASGRAAWLGIVIASALFLTLILGPVIARLVFSDQVDFPLAHAQLKTTILTLLGAAVSLPGVMAIWLVDAATGEIPKSRGDAMDRLKELLWLRAQLLSLATRLAGTIALVTLASGALRNALQDGPASFPNYLVFVYGAYFTALFALLYVPVYSNLKSAGQDLIDHTYPIVLPDSADFQDRQGEREAMESLLQLRVGTADSLKIVGIFLAPLITSLVTVLVGITVG
jgi:hypothetical protein